MVELQANATPDAVAVRFEDATVTYRQLMARADELARRLIAAGVAPETPVAIYLDRSVEYVVAMLAVLKAGRRLCPARSDLPARPHQRDHRRGRRPELP